MESRPVITTVYTSLPSVFFLFLFGLVECSLENVGIKRELEL